MSISSKDISLTRPLEPAPGTTQIICDNVQAEINDSFQDDINWFADHTDQVFWIVENNNLKYLNLAFYEITGLARQPIPEIPKSFLKIIHPDDRPLVLKELYSKTSVNCKASCMFRIIKKDHEIRWISVESYRISGENVASIKKAGIGKDITEIKHFDDCLKAAKEKAQESDSLKAAFLNNLNHEIRTPMNGIMGFSELLSIPDLSEKKRSYYTSLIINESKKLLGIVTDLIIASKTEANTIGFNKKRFSLNDTLRQVFYQFKEKHETESLEFILHLGLDDRESILYSGKDQIIQVLHYLLSNSVKFTKSGHIGLSCVLVNNKITISVKDTGIGIDKKHHETIFAVFRQVENTLDKSHGGNGLGLSIAKKLVNYLEGDIWLSSELQLGTTVYFTIPYITD